jgi:hypothetical protein
VRATGNRDSPQLKPATQSTPIRTSIIICSNKVKARSTRTFPEAADDGERRRGGGRGRRRGRRRRAVALGRARLGRRGVHRTSRGSGAPGSGGIRRGGGRGDDARGGACMRDLLYEWVFVRPVVWLLRRAMVRLLLLALLFLPRGDGELARPGGGNVRVTCVFSCCLVISLSWIWFAASDSFSLVAYNSLK